MIIEVNRGEGVTELVPLKRFLRDVKDVFLVLSVVIPNVFGLMFIWHLMRHPAACAVYWLVSYGWLALFTYANCRKRKDRSAGRHSRS